MEKRYRNKIIIIIIIIMMARMGHVKRIMLVVAAVDLRFNQSVVGQAVTTTTTLTKIPAVQRHGSVDLILFC